MRERTRFEQEVALLGAEAAHEVSTAGMWTGKTVESDALSAANLRRVERGEVSVSDLTDIEFCHRFRARGMACPKLKKNDPLVSRWKAIQKDVIRKALERLPGQPEVTETRVEFPGAGGCGSSRRFLTPPKGYAGGAACGSERRYVGNSQVLEKVDKRYTVGGKAVQLHWATYDAYKRLKAAVERAPELADLPGLGSLLLIQSGFRSVEKQKDLWAGALKKYKSAAEAAKYVARPGCSLHHSGCAVDFRLGRPGNGSEEVEVQRLTRLYRWLVCHAAEFGFYPYPAEPWHWEYNPPGFDYEAPRGSGRTAPARREEEPVASASASAEPEALGSLRALLKSGRVAQSEVDSILRSTTDTKDRVNRISNLVYRALYPGYPTDASKSAAATKAWLRVRDEVVRPGLAELGTGTVGRPGTAPPAAGMSLTEAKRLLEELGYPVDRAGGEAEAGAQLDAFAADSGLKAPHGKVTPAVAGALAERREALHLLRQEKPHARRLSRFRVTVYHVAVEKPENGPATVPIMDPDFHTLVMVNPKFAVDLCLQGSGRTRDGRMLNVAGKDKIPVPPLPVFADLYQTVSAAYSGNAKRMERSGFGFQNGRVTSMLAFREVPRDKLGPEGYPILRKIPMAALRTLAADIGADRKCMEKKYKGKGGLVPAKTRVFIAELVGAELAGGRKHDGWCVVNDTGGAIYGAHFDLFAGTSDDSKRFRNTGKLPRICHVWFEGSETRVPPDYRYGLSPEDCR